MNTHFDKFKEKALKKFGSKFDYSQFQYTDAKTKSVIVCPDHGPFDQSPDKHLQSVWGCPACWTANRSSSINSSNKARREAGLIRKGPERVSKQAYESRFRAKYGDIFELDLSEYSGLTSGKATLICRDHGGLTTSPINFLISKYGCPMCSVTLRSLKKTKSFEYMVQQVREVHGDALEILPESKSSYKNKRSPVEVRCTKGHGVFSKKPQKLLAGQGCFKCRIEELVSDGTLKGGYSEKYIRDNPESSTRPAYLYYFRIGNMYKVGVSVNLEQRVRALNSLLKRRNYSSRVEVIDTEEMPLKDAIRTESEILRLYSADRLYTKFSTEVFKRNVLKGLSLKSLHESLLHIPTTTPHATPKAG